MKLMITKRDTVKKKSQNLYDKLIFNMMEYKLWNILSVLF